MAESTVARYRKLTAAFKQSPLYPPVAADDPEALVESLARDLEAAGKPPNSLTDTICNIAACVGSQEIIAGAFEAGWLRPETAWTALYFAVAAQQLPIVRHLLVVWGVGRINGADNVLHHCYEMAAYQGDTAMLEWLTATQSRTNDFAVYMGAIDGNQPATADWARERGCRLNTAVMGMACRRARWWFLVWATDVTPAERRPHWPEWRYDGLTCDAAAGGHIDVIAWLRANDCPWSPDCWMTAFEAGQFPTLRHLTLAGCPRGHFPEALDGVLAWLQTRHFEVSAADVEASPLSPDERGHLLEVIRRHSEP